MKVNYVFVTLLLAAFLFVAAYVYLFARWKHLWEQERPFARYETAHHQDDTLRVVMIGDSWAGMHQGFDGFLSSALQEHSGFPVSFMSKGKGGAKSKEIYQMMFEPGEDGTRALLSEGPDYCIVSAGINDAAANLGTEQFCHYYRQIIDFLLQNDIRPVVLEIPDVKIWTVAKHKPVKDIFYDFLKSTMTHCGTYSYGEYRKALAEMLANEQLEEHVLYVPMERWNGMSPGINKKLFLDDTIHLNREGYELLDICIAQFIADDYKSRRRPLLSISQ